MCSDAQELVPLCFNSETQRATDGIAQHVPLIGQDELTKAAATGSPSGVQASKFSANQNDVYTFADAPKSRESKDESARPTLAHFWGEVVWLLKLAVPMFIQYIGGYSSSLVSLMFVGHLGRQEMSFAVLGTSFSNVSGFALLTGLSSALETLCGQAYGAKDYSKVGIALQRGTIVCSFCFILMLPIWLNFTPVMVAMGQQQTLAEGASRYMRRLIPGIAFAAGFQCLNRYLSAASIVAPQAYASIASFFISPVVCFLFVSQRGFGLGVDGAAWAVSLINFLQFGILQYFVMQRHRQLAGTDTQTWHGWSFTAFKGLWEYLKLAGPGACMIIVEWSTFETMILLSGLLPQPGLSTAAMGWLFSVSTSCYLVPLSLGGAASTRVSNALGANRPMAARLTTLTSGCMAFVSSSCLTILFLAIRKHVGWIFTRDANVNALGSSVLLILAPALVGDGINAVMAGVVRGAGRQILGAVTNMFSYYLIGIPLASICAFKLGWDIHGLWVGLLIATSMQGAILTFCVAKFDWTVEAARAADRMVALNAKEAEHGALESRAYEANIV